MHPICITSVLLLNLCIPCMAYSGEATPAGEDFATILSGGLKLGIYHGRCVRLTAEHKDTWEIHDLLKYVNPIDGSVVLIEARVTTTPDFQIVKGRITRRAGDSVIEISVKQQGEQFTRSTKRRGRTRTHATLAPHGVRYIFLALRRLRQINLARPGDRTDVVYMVADNVIREMKMNVGTSRQRSNFNKQFTVVPVDMYLRRNREDEYMLTQKVELSPENGKLVWGRPVTAGGLRYALRPATKNNWEDEFPPKAEKVKALLEPVR